MWMVSVPRLWRIFVNLLDLNYVAKTRQHWVYALFAVVLAILVHAGLLMLLPLLAFFYFRFPKSYWIFILVFGASLMLLHFDTKEPTLPELNSEKTTYTAQIIQVRRRSEKRQTAIIDINKKRVFMTFNDGDPQIVPGQTVEIVGRLVQPSDPTVPHRFNFRNFLRNQGIYLTIHTSELTVTDTNFSPWRFQYNLAAWIQGRFPPLTSSYLQAFFLGIRDDMDDATMDIYSDLGILHIFAISGIHLNLMSEIVRVVLKQIGLIETLIDIILIVFCIAFLFITGGSVSIIRACAMTIFAILNRQIKLDLSSFDIFSIVFLANFVLKPQLVYQRGFQLSYWITFVLICCRPALQGLTPIRARMSIVFLARMAAIPLTVSSLYVVNMTSYLTNLLLVPVLMQLIMPVLLISLFLPILSPLTEFLLRSFEYINEFLGSILTINITFGNVPLLIVILLLTLLLISCYVYENYKKMWIRLALIAVYVLILEMNRLWQPYTSITFLDVGQGDATIIRSPYQACTIVIDTGGDVSRIHRENPSIFSNTLEPYLLGAGVRNIDFLILTHEHYDHVGEAINLMSGFNVRNILLSEAEWGFQLLAIAEEAQRLGIPIHIVRPFDTFSCANQVYTFIHDEIDNLNVDENSLVTTVEIDGFNVLLTGDIGHITEPAILANNHLAHFDIYQVAHHGSRHSNSLEFLDALNIKYAVVQAGRNNFYGHPSVELFEVVNELNIPLLNNAQHGTVQFRLLNDNYQISIWPLDP